MNTRLLWAADPPAAGLRADANLLTVDKQQWSAVAMRHIHQGTSLRGKMRAVNADLATTPCFDWQPALSDSTTASASSRSLLVAGYASGNVIFTQLESHSFHRAALGIHGHGAGAGAVDVVDDDSDDDDDDETESDECDSDYDDSDDGGDSGSDYIDDAEGLLDAMVVQTRLRSLNAQQRPPNPRRRSSSSVVVNGLHRSNTRSSVYGGANGVSPEDERNALSSKQAARCRISHPRTLTSSDMIGFSDIGLRSDGGFSEAASAAVSITASVAQTPMHAPTKSLMIPTSGQAHVIDHPHLTTIGYHHYHQVDRMRAPATYHVLPPVWEKYHNPAQQHPVSRACSVVKLCPASPAAASRLLLSGYQGSGYRDSPGLCIWDVESIQRTNPVLDETEYLTGSSSSGHNSAQQQISTVLQQMINSTHHSHSVQPLRKFAYGHGVVSAAWHPHAPQVPVIAAGLESNALTLFDMRCGYSSLTSADFVHSTNTDATTNVSFCPHHPTRLVSTTSSGDIIKLWDVRMFSKSVGEIRPPAGQYFRHVSFIPTRQNSLSTLLAPNVSSSSSSSSVGSAGSHVRVWDLCQGGALSQNDIHEDAKNCNAFAARYYEYLAKQVDPVTNTLLHENVTPVHGGISSTSSPNQPIPMPTPHQPPISRGLSNTSSLGSGSIDLKLKPGSTRTHPGQPLEMIGIYDPASAQSPPSVTITEPRQSSIQPRTYAATPQITGSAGSMAVSASGSGGGGSSSSAVTAASGLLGSSGVSTPLRATHYTGTVPSLGQRASMKTLPGADPLNLTHASASSAAQLPPLQPQPQQLLRTAGSSGSVGLRARSQSRSHSHSQAQLQLQQLQHQHGSRIVPKQRVPTGVPDHRASSSLHYPAESVIARTLPLEISNDSSVSVAPPDIIYATRPPPVTSFSQSQLHPLVYVKEHRAKSSAEEATKWIHAAFGSSSGDACQIIALRSRALGRTVANPCAVAFAPLIATAPNQHLVTQCAVMAVEGSHGKSVHVVAMRNPSSASFNVRNGLAFFNNGSVNSKWNERPMVVEPRDWSLAARLVREAHNIKESSQISQMSSLFDTQLSQVQIHPQHQLQQQYQQQLQMTLPPPITGPAGSRLVAALASDISVSMRLRTQHAGYRLVRHSSTAISSMAPTVCHPEFVFMGPPDVSFAVLDRLWTYIDRVRDLRASGWLTVYHSPADSSDDSATRKRPDADYSTAGIRDILFSIPSNHISIIGKRLFVHPAGSAPQNSALAHLSMRRRIALVVCGLYDLIDRLVTFDYSSVQPDEAELVVARVLMFGPSDSENIAAKVLESSDSDAHKLLAIILQGSGIGEMIHSLKLPITSNDIANNSIDSSQYNGSGGGNNDSTSLDAEINVYVEVLESHSVSPYLACIFEFLATKDSSKLLYSTVIPIAERIALALLYLSDSDLQDFISSLASKALASGDLGSSIVFGPDAADFDSLVRRNIDGPTPRFITRSVDSAANGYSGKRGGYSPAMSTLYVVPEFMALDSPMSPNMPRRRTKKENRYSQQQLRKNVTWQASGRSQAGGSVKSSSSSPESDWHIVAPRQSIVSATAIQTSQPNSDYDDALYEALAWRKLLSRTSYAGSDIQSSLFALCMFPLRRAKTELWTIHIAAAFRDLLNRWRLSFERTRFDTARNAIVRDYQQYLDGFQPVTFKTQSLTIRSKFRASQTHVVHIHTPPRPRTAANDLRPASMLDDDARFLIRLFKNGWYQSSQSDLHILRTVAAMTTQATTIPFPLPPSPFTSQFKCSGATSQMALVCSQCRVPFNNVVFSNLIEKDHAGMTRVEREERGIVAVTETPSLVQSSNTGSGSLGAALFRGGFGVTASSAGISSTTRSSYTDMDGNPLSQMAQPPITVAASLILGIDLEQQATPSQLQSFMRYRESHQNFYGTSFRDETLAPPKPVNSCSGRYPLPGYSFTGSGGNSMYSRHQSGLLCPWCQSGNDRCIVCRIRFEQQYLRASESTPLTGDSAAPPNHAQLNEKLVQLMDDTLSWCNKCGHAGHTKCLLAWRSSSSSSSDRCAVPHCRCDCP